jgi:hypothetical protein
MSPDEKNSLTSHTTVLHQMERTGKAEKGKVCHFSSMLSYVSNKSTAVHNVYATVSVANDDTVP